MNFKSWKITTTVKWKSSQKETVYVSHIYVKEDFSHIRESLERFILEIQRECPLLACGAYSFMTVILTDENDNKIKECHFSNVEL